MRLTIARLVVAVLLGLLTFARPATAGEPNAAVTAALVPSVATAPLLSAGLSDDAWKSAVAIPLAYDLRTHASDLTPPIAYALLCKGRLYVAFRVQQTSRIVADHLQNDAGLGSDDAVSVYLYPDGPSGYAYIFAVNPRGTHQASSSENSSYAPTWQSFGKQDGRGYVVTMWIPLDAMKGGANGTWRANFRRYESDTLDDDLWSYGPSASPGNDPPATVAGILSGFPVHAAAAYPRIRVGLYGLGEVASPSVGGSTSRMGVDASIPLTRTASFVSTVHPDYSNVEVDQQSITPTAFPRYFDEVRPFFTQLDNGFNAFSVNAPITVQPLYSYLIPTPRYGNAIEGKQGPFSFAAFDAVGDERDDNGQALSFQTADSRTTFSLQREMTSLPGFTDELQTQAVSYDTQKGLAANLVSAEERSPLITDDAQARWLTAGITSYDHDQAFNIAWERIGSQFYPIDAYVQNTDVAGWSANYVKTWYRPNTSRLPRMLLYAQSDLFHNAAGVLGQSDNQLALGADVNRFLGLPALAHVRAQIGSSYVRLPDGALVATTQNALELTYGYRTATPTLLSYATGRFGPGTLDYWTRQINVHLVRSVTMLLEDDDGDQRLDSGERNRQWLLKGSLVWEQSPSRSLSVGARRVIGASPVLEWTPSSQPSPPVNQWNLSAAFYARWPHSELYVVYGDPNRATTVPALIVKLLRYIGADKGV